MTADGYHGSDRRKKTESIHPWRWRGLVIWIAVFTAIVFFSLAQLRQNKASVAQLEKTNCALRSFLFTAAQARIAIANDKTVTPDDRKIARRAAKGYLRLYDLFPQDGCGRISPSGNR